MRKPIIVGNWKMNKLRGDAKEFVCAIEEYLTGEEASTYGIAAPFTCLVECVDNAKNLVVAAQNCHWKESGAFTGEVSVEMLEDVGVTYCVIGHSERRSMFGDTDETVNLKASKLLDENIIPILCIGETEAQYDAGETEKVIREQISGSMKGLCPHCVGKMVVAYEPIWAIGTGKSATKEIAQNCCHIVRDQIRVMFGDEAADKVRIQYGGSVKPENIKEYMACEDIDGALIGGASLKVDSFKAIIDATK
ncbi:MAG: triose-phosphate isomerase [Firmicutes bacterium]|nr:triose-phosphate isomerase [Erysipelotrichaceae bacterium]MDD6526125.1 triose-phosphate isomerase [Bacillota bacterium]MDD7228332.1 triose-phosphate isomerase [Bacillota bacterium]MDY4972891.1 triose-phosphate isomerase [Erysipelotrichaceae bacterium]MDY5997375.1 triose-phosphate isomerase [Erysipelotrichaceae bacterium]